MKLTVLTVLILILINNLGCTQPKLGITHLKDQDQTQEIEVSTSEVDLKSHDDTFKQGMIDLKEELLSRNRKKVTLLKMKLKQKKLKKKYDKQTISNLEKLGVYNIGKRLDRPLGTYNKYPNKKRKVFVRKEDPNKDRFGGKLICNKEVLTFRIDRSLFISCMNDHDDISDFSFNKLFVNYDLMNIMQHKIDDTPTRCKVKLAISHNSYNDLTECLIADRANGGFFKFRNPNSLSYKFKIIKEK